MGKGGRLPLVKAKIGTYVIPYPNNPPYDTARVASIQTVICPNDLQFRHGKIISRFQAQKERKIFFLAALPRFGFSPQPEMAISSSSLLAI